MCVFFHWRLCVQTQAAVQHNETLSHYYYTMANCFYRILLFCALVLTHHAIHPSKQTSCQATPEAKDECCPPVCYDFEAGKGWKR